MTAIAMSWATGPSHFALLSPAREALAHAARPPVPADAVGLRHRTVVVRGGKARELTGPGENVVRSLGERPG